MAKKNYLVDIDLNNNELQNAVIHNVNVLPTLTSANLVDVGKIVYLVPTSTAYILNNVEGVATWEPIGKGTASGGGGGVFVMGVSSNVSGQNATATSANSDGEDIIEVTATTKNLRFNLLALTGSKNLKPVITYTLGTSSTVYPIPSNSFIKQTDRPVYLATNYVINLGTANYITFIHEDGATKRVNVVTESLPVVQSVVFTGGYPVGQTELAENNPIRLTVTSDSPITSIIVYDENACKAITYNYTDNLFTKTINVQAAARTTGTYGAVVAVTKSGGAVSAKYYSETAGSVDGVNVMKLNNTVPLLSAFSIGYPSGFTAIKTDTSATVGCTITNLGTLGDYEITYSSPGSQLTIPNTTTYATSKTVTTAWSGYNVDTSNYTIFVKKTSNGRTASQSATVWIASVAPIINISLPANRLISSPSGQQHIITATSNQNLKSLTLNPASGGGSWLTSNVFNVANPVNATNTLVINDTIVKGNYSFTNLAATNIAGMVTTTTTTGQYVVGGFTLRTITLPQGYNYVSLPVALTTQAGNINLSRAILTWKGVILTQDILGTALPTDSNTSKPGKWAASAANVNPTQLRLLDYGAFQATTTDTVITIQEPA
jgi:hypothetical protein